VAELEMFLLPLLQLLDGGAREGDPQPPYGPRLPWQHSISLPLFST